MAKKNILRPRAGGARLAQMASDANSRANPGGRAGYGLRGAGVYIPPWRWVKRPRRLEYGRVTKRTRIT